MPFDQSNCLSYLGYVNRDDVAILKIVHTPSEWFEWHNQHVHTHFHARVFIAFLFGNAVIVSADMQAFSMIQ